MTSLVGLSTVTPPELLPWPPLDPESLGLLVGAGVELAETDVLGAALGCDPSALSDEDPHAVMVNVDKPMMAPSAAVFIGVFMVREITADRGRFTGCGNKMVSSGQIAS